MALELVLRSTFLHVEEEESEDEASRASSHPRARSRRRRHDGRPFYVHDSLGNGWRKVEALPDGSPLQRCTTLPDLRDARRAEEARGDAEARRLPGVEEEVCPGTGAACSAAAQGASPSRQVRAARFGALASRPSLKSNSEVTPEAACEAEVALEPAHFAAPENEQDSEPAENPRGAEPVKASRRRKRNPRRLLLETSSRSSAAGTSAETAALPAESSEVAHTTSGASSSSTAWASKRATASAMVLGDGGTELGKGRSRAKQRPQPLSAAKSMPLPAGQVASSSQCTRGGCDSPVAEARGQAGGQGSYTTVMLRNMPTSVTRGQLRDLLDSKGWLARCDFLYVPMDFRTDSGLGFAFVNLVSPIEAHMFRRHFAGFSDWGSGKPCNVSWASPNQQGLDANIERYRNSSVMHRSVRDEWKPMVLVGGVPTKFPKNTKRLWPPHANFGARANRDPT